MQTFYYETDLFIIVYLNIAIHLNLNGVSVVHASLNPSSCCIINKGKAIQLQFYPVGLPAFHQCLLASGPSFWNCSTLVEVMVQPLLVSDRPSYMVSDFFLILMSACHYLQG